MSNLSVDLKQAIVDQDLYTIQCFVVDQQNLLLKDWFNESRQNFRSTLQRSIQKSRKAKLQLIASGGEISYQLGIWEGWLQAFHTLFDEDRKENEILELAVAKSPNTKRIICFLYQYGRPICHGELADALEMNYSTLTNAMKRAIGCGAVSASRTGRNTRYILTSAAKQYCQKEMKWEKVLPKSRETLLLEELLKIYQKKKVIAPLSVKAGDTVQILEGDGKCISEKKLLTQIVQIGAQKMLELKPIDNDDPLVASPSIKSDALDLEQYNENIVLENVFCGV